MSNQDKSFSLTAFLVGGILGASASLLFTPRSGKEVRTDIKHRTDNYLNEVNLRRDILIHRSKTTGELLKRKAEELVDSIKNYANGKIEKPLSMFEKEIAGLRSAINAARASYSSIPETHGTRVEETVNQFRVNTMMKCCRSISVWEREGIKKVSIRKIIISSDYYCLRCIPLKRRDYILP